MIVMVEWKPNTTRNRNRRPYTEYVTPSQAAIDLQIKKVTIIEALNKYGSLETDWATVYSLAGAKAAGKEWGFYKDNKRL